jgi:ABC-2 type transport system ATP-binding protein
VLAIEAVTVRYPRLKRPALDAVSLEVNPGEVVALLGPNGAGKTTMMKAICGLVKPAAGRVRVGGVDAIASPEEARRRLSLLIHAERSFYYRLTGFQNLLFFAGMENLFGARACDKVDQLLTRFGLEEARDTPFMKYSLGMRKKLSLARMLLRDPGLVLLDEPTANLDPASVREVLELLNGLRAEGKAILIATHQLSEVERIADRVALLRTGRLLACDRLHNLKVRHHGPKLQLALAEPVATSLLQKLERLPGVRALDTSGLGGKNPPLQVVLLLETTADLSALLAALGGLGLPVVQINQSEPTLEEVFLEAVA